MNRPIIRIVMDDGKAYPLAQGTASEPSPSAGAVPTPSHGAQPSNLRAATGEAEGFSPVPSVSPTPQPCIPCEGQGEREWLSFDETEWRWHICEDCDGTGYAKKPYCDVCQSNLTADLFCVSCDDWASLVYVERIAPGRVAL